MKFVESARKVGLVAAATLAMVACSSSNDEGQTQQAIGGPSVSTSTSYTAGQTITVNYSGLPGNTLDWVAVSNNPSADTSFIEYHYTGGAVSGTQDFHGLPAGDYEARAYSDDSYTVIARFDFTVAPDNTPQPSVSTDSLTYTAGQSVTLNYMNLPGNQSDWVAVSIAGSPDNSYVAWHYTNGAQNGSQVFDGLPANNYEARAYLNDTFTRLATSTFTINGTGSATVTTDASSYTSGQTVTASWTNLPGNTYDWVGIYAPGAPDSSFIAWHYTNGVQNGSQAFAGLANGNYEARAYLNDSFTRLATSATFTIGSPSVSASASTYASGADVTINFSTLPGNTYDWIAISQVGSGNTSYVAWHYTGGAVSGSQLFSGIADGDYEARAYVNDTFTRIATSAPFHIGATAAPSVSTAPNYAPGDPITVNWSDLPGNQYDWVGLYNSGDADTSIIVWSYTNGAANGSHVFGNGLPAGSYEARAFSNDSYNRLATTSFTVGP